MASTRKGKRPAANSRKKVTNKSKVSKKQKNAIVNVGNADNLSLGSAPSSREPNPPTTNPPTTNPPTTNPPGPPTAAEAAFAARWPVEKPSKAAQAASREVALRSLFWGHKDRLPRCFSCKRTNASMPRSPITEGNFVPCGCDYDQAMLEMWLEKKGLWDGENAKDMPKTLGKHRVCMIMMFEIFFGAFSVEKMLNVGGSRIEACKAIIRAEDRLGDPLKPHDTTVE